MLSSSGVGFFFAIMYYIKIVHCKLIDAIFLTTCYVVIGVFRIAQLLLLFSCCCCSVLFEIIPISSVFDIFQQMHGEIHP